MPIGSIGPTRSRCLAKLRVVLGDGAYEEETGPMTRDEIFDDLEAMWTERDPVPDGLVERMQALAAAEVTLRPPTSTTS